MKPRYPAVIAVCLAGAIGFLAGKYMTALPAAKAKSSLRTDATGAPPQVNAANGSTPNAQVSAPDSGKENTKTAVSPGPPERFSKLYERAAKLTPQEFGERLGSLLAGSKDADSHLEIAAMFTCLDGERATAACLVYKKKTGSSLREHNADLGPLLVAGGQRDGAKLLAALQREVPDLQDIASAVHGWATAEPRAAVDWYNNLPDDYSRRKDSLNGLMFGLAQSDSAIVKQVFHSSLSPEDQKASAALLSRSLVIFHGTEAVDRLIEGLPPEIAVRCLEGATDRRGRRPADVMATWLASHLGASAGVDRAFMENFSRWREQDAAAAENWRSTAATANPRLDQVLSPTADEGSK